MSRTPNERLIVETTLDLDAQRDAERAVSARLVRDGGERSTRSQAALVP